MRMKNVKKMPGSAVAKKIIKIINLGIVLVCSLLAMVFFVYMGSMFGYKDLDCESYLETRRFADSLWQIMSRISGEIAWTENYVMKMSPEFRFPILRTTVIREWLREAYMQRACRIWH